MAAGHRRASPVGDAQTAAGRPARVFYRGFPLRLACTSTRCPVLNEINGFLGISKGSRHRRMTGGSSGSSRPRARSVVAWLLLASWVAIGGVILWKELAERRAGHDFVRAVDRATQARVNDAPVDDASILLAALKQVDHVAAHHSHPMAPIRIDLLDGSSESHVVIARDSARSTEFWAFWPSGHGLAGDPGEVAGRIVSGDLDAFLRQRGL